MNGGDLSIVEQLGLKYFTEHKSREEIMKAENNYYLNYPQPQKLLHTSETDLKTD